MVYPLDDSLSATNSPVFNRTLTVCPSLSMVYRESSLLSFSHSSGGAVVAAMTLNWKFSGSRSTNSLATLTASYGIVKQMARFVFRGVFFVEEEEERGGLGGKQV